MENFPQWKHRLTTLLPNKVQPTIKGSGNNKLDVITISDALTLTKFGKFNYVIIFVSSIILTNVLFEIGFILPMAQCDLQMTNHDMGLLTGIVFVGVIVSSHLWGFLADTKGRRRVMRPTLIAGFVVSLFASFSQKFWIMVVLRFIKGFCLAGSSSTIYAYLSEFHTDKTRSRAMMAFLFLFSLSCMSLPLSAYLVINQGWTLALPILGIIYKPWRLFMVICATPGLLCGLSLYILPESPKFLLSIGREDRTIEVIEQMHRWNGGKEALKITHILPEEDGIQLEADSSTSSNFILGFLQAMWNDTIPLFQKRYLRTTLIVCTIQFWLYLITNGLYMWFPHIISNMVEFMKTHPGEQKQICQVVYDKQESLYKDDGSMECMTKLENNTFLYSLAMNISYAASFAFLGLIINSVSKVTVLFITMVFFASCGLAAVFVLDPAISAYLFVLVFLVGVAINVLGATTVELYPTHLRAKAICLSLMVGRVGSVMGANISGALMGHFCELTFYVSCCGIIGCSFLVLLLPRKSLEERNKCAVEES